MNRSVPSSALPATHTVPTHLATTDTVLSFGWISLSPRQFLLLLVGLSLAVSLWKDTLGLVAALGLVGTVLHWFVLLLYVVVLFAITFGKAAGRTFDAWGIVVLAYLVRPRVYRWQSFRERSVSAPVFISSSVTISAEKEAA